MIILKPKFWDSKKSFISYYLLPFSLILQLLILIKKKFIKKKFFEIPVFCIGNIYLGGTGKTPLSIEVATILKKVGKNPAVIKKFYSEHNDEVNLIKKNKIELFNLPSRIDAIREAIKQNFNVAILDDGFQDTSINKNLNILCFNEKQLIGNGMTIPSGPLRETFNSIKRSQIVIINSKKNQNFENKVKKVSEKINIFYSKFEPLNIKDFKNKNLLAFAGIGNPENFFDLLEENNLNVKKKIAFPDHYNYLEKDIKKIKGYAEKNNLTIITTEKDYCRLNSSHKFKIEFLSINLKIFKKNEFINEISKYL